MKKYFITSLFLMSVLIAPITTQAVTIEELQAQINALMATIQQLQQTIASLGGGSSTSTDNPIPIFGLNVNDRIEVIIKGDTATRVNVRNISNGALLGQQTIGSLGTIVDGVDGPPISITGSDGYTRFYVNFDSGVDGWVAGQFFSDFTTIRTPKPGTHNCNGISIGLS